MRYWFGLIAAVMAGCTGIGNLPGAFGQQGANDGPSPFQKASPEPSPNQSEASQAPGPSSGTLQFQYSVVDPSQITEVTPLGWISPPHVVPSNHIYFYHDDPSSPTHPPVNVYAPAAGTVSRIQSNTPTDGGIYVNVTSSTSYYIYHVTLDPSISEGSSIVAGQVLGKSDINASAVDLGVINANVTRHFINPARYGDDSLHGDAPLKYYVDPLKTTLYSLVKTDGTEKDGKFDDDIEGALVGGWYHNSLAVSDTDGPDGPPKTLAFAYDMYHPNRTVIAIGGTLPMVGAWYPQIGAPDPASVSVPSGIVSYRLFMTGLPSDPYPSTFPQSGLLIAQLLDKDSLKVEVFTPSTDGTASFDTNAQIYIR